MMFKFATPKMERDPVLDKEGTPQRRAFLIFLFLLSLKGIINTDPVPIPLGIIESLVCHLNQLLF